MVARKSQSRGDISLKKPEHADNAFTKRQHPTPTSKGEVPVRVILIFIFAVVFCLFAVYKVFIYKKAYDFSPVNYLSTGLSLDLQPITIELEPSTDNTETPNEELASTSTPISTLAPEAKLQTTQQTTSTDSTATGLNTHWIDRNADALIIEQFYQHLVNGKIADMNTLVHLPLKNSVTWKNHRNQKNISIFIRNLVGNLKLENIFLIPGTTNTDKKSRQYSYTLSYTVTPDHSFLEDWKVTLLTNEAGETQISEIMCTTTKCSFSPFFWPQNYNLK